MRIAASLVVLVFNYRDQMLGMLEMQDANLSPDGYRMFFGGVRMGQSTERVFAIDRSDLTMPFEAANIVEVHNTTQTTLSPRSPYVTADCSSLWFSLATNSGTIRNGVPQ